MSIVERHDAQRTQTSAVGLVLSAVVVAWVGFALVADLEPNGRHLLVLGALRIVLFAGLLAFAIHVAAATRGLGRAGIVAGGLGAAATLVGGVGAVLTDGWSYNPFAPGSALAPPWYAYVIGAGAFVFAIGAVLVGLGGRRAGWLAWAAVAGGALYPLVLALQGLLGRETGQVVGHLIWIAPWLALGLGLIARDQVAGRSARS